VLISAGQTEDFSSLSSLVRIRVKIYGHHPNEKIEIGTTPKLINLPDSVEDLFSVAGMSITSKLATFNMHACLKIILSGFSRLNDIVK
jgi:hypothetical protein